MCIYHPHSLLKFSRLWLLYVTPPWHPRNYCGDFNNYLNADLDKLSTRAPTSNLRGGPTSFARLLMELGLRDVWRIKNPQVKCYSCHSATHRGLSRIDLCLGNDAMLPLISSSSYEAKTVSNHSPLCVAIITSGVSKRTC